MFYLDVAILPAPQCVKSSTDLYFSVGMSHIERHVNETESDVHFPIHFLAVLECNGGVATTYTELCSIDRSVIGLEMIQTVK